MGVLNYGRGLFTSDRESKHRDTCAACAAHLEHIASLKETIERLTKERDAERSEFKRAIDALLIKNDSAPLGQGAPEMTLQDKMILDPAKYFAFLDEETDLAGKNEER